MIRIQETKTEYLLPYQPPKRKEREGFRAGDGTHSVFAGSIRATPGCIMLLSQNSAMI